MCPVMKSSPHWGRSFSTGHRTSWGSRLRAAPPVAPPPDARNRYDYKLNTDLEYKEIVKQKRWMICGSPDNDDPDPSTCEAAGEPRTETSESTTHASSYLSCYSSISIVSVWVSERMHVNFCRQNTSSTAVNSKTLQLSAKQSGWINPAAGKQVNCSFKVRERVGLNDVVLWMITHLSTWKHFHTRQ